MLAMTPITPEMQVSAQKPSPQAPYTCKDVVNSRSASCTAVLRVTS